MIPAARFDSARLFLKARGKAHMQYQRLTDDSQSGELPTTDEAAKRKQEAFPVGKPPDLQELVARFGGYDKITPEGWEQHHRASADWQEQRRAYYRTLNMKGPKP
jgi:hypothetical protein